LIGHEARVFLMVFSTKLQEARNPVRITTLFRKLLCVTSLILVKGVSLSPVGLIVRVRPGWRKPRCGRCGKVAPGYDTRPVRRWQHLALGRMVIWLAYAPRRVQCADCGVLNEEVPWAAGESRFTWEFEELAAYLSQITDRTKVTGLLGIAWLTVGRIVERVVARKLNPGRLDNLRFIGVDEFSYRKRHKYLTVVVDHDRRRIVWAKEGRSYEVLKEFFQTLGVERCFKIEAATIDMAGGYEKAIQEWLPQAEVVFDRFHVQKLASDALDEVRRSIVRELHGSPEEASEVKGTRFVLLKKPEDLSGAEKVKLSEVQRTNRRLYRAYLLKETLGAALDYAQPKRAEGALRRWIGWAVRSRLKPFVRTARTIRRHFDGVLAYVKTRLTNGLVEGINNKLRMIARRAFGFHSAGALIGSLFLSCGGIELNPPIPSNPLEC